MATFSTAQVRQLYVVLDEFSGGNTAGEFAVQSSSDDVWFKYVTPNGDFGGTSIVRSDLINKNQVKKVVATAAKQVKLKQNSIVLNTSINSGNPVVGQEYILRFTFFGLGIGGRENQYIKNGGAYKVKTGDTAATVYNKLVELAKINFSREAYPLVKIGVNGVAASATMTTNAGVTVTAKEAGTAGNSITFAVASVSATSPSVTVNTVAGVTTITASLTAAAKTIGDLKTLVEANTNLVTISGTAATTVVVEATGVSLTNGTSTGILIEEVMHPWVLGKRQAASVDFVINTVPITVDASQVPWGTITDTTLSNTNVIKNGRMTADMEWFYLGERADQYRGMGYPDNFESVYLVNPAKEYDFIDIHYYYEGSGTAVQKSEKYITLAIPKDSGYAIADIITALGTAGLTVEDLT